MATRKLYINDLVPNRPAVVGYRHHSWNTVFLGFVLDSDGKPRANFRDFDGMEWDAYLHEGKFCVGSSADELRVLDTRPNARTQIETAQRDVRAGN